MDMNIPFENLSGIFKNILENKQLTFVEKENIAEDDLIARDWIKEGEFDYLLFLPLVIYDELIGVLFCHSPKKDMTLTKEKLDKLGRFTELIAGSVFNAQLLKKVEESKELAESAKMEAEIEKNIAQMAQKESEVERQKSEKLLLNILPKDVAKELKEKGFAEPVLFENVSVMFTDFKGFTTIAEGLSPKKLVEELDQCFSYFDALMERYHLEKLKTIGDSYMCAGGIPNKNTTHAIDCVLAALEIQSIMQQMKELKEMAGLPYWELRLGIHSGSLVAGVIGEKKFAYDVWGDTVNTASRMESSGTPGKINISGSTYEFVKDFFECEYRGKVKAKNKGDVDMYYVEGLKKRIFQRGRQKNSQRKVLGQSLRCLK
ncbi:MAG: adenylate/guanylate cyclase domain-containing protein [Leptospiraceae bacterium]|nr:adenylate/guanylate cyclase domain-containing protein [Leptospiraceae bacterium]